MLRIEPALESQFDDYFLLRCDENNILWSGHSQAPAYENLKKWYLQNIKKKERHFFLCYDNQAIAGYLYLDHGPANSLDVGYGVYYTMTGKGLGSEIISFATNFAKQTNSIERITAWVADENIASWKVFLKHGYTKTSDTRNVRFEKTGRVMLFHKYQKELTKE